MSLILELVTELKYIEDNYNDIEIIKTVYSDAIEFKIFTLTKKLKIELVEVNKNTGEIVNVCDTFYLRDGGYIFLNREKISFNNFDFEILNEFNKDFLDDYNLSFKIT